MPDYVSRNGKTILIPTATMLADALHALPHGVTSKLADVRNRLAIENDAESTCPVTTQKLLIQFSQDGDVPYWRVIDPEKPFAKRLSGGAEQVRNRLDAERG